ncbi:hypothetical protein ColTof4_08523 [Colletotrichum tofieldiae]|uniref:Uncharacterized protein n=1 Tax=Colletotrichum tofieldiae TaxID=708197 RepID=A0A161VJ19_9PEZI|nr:hypothetical protein CT0861_10095 [Colletotrichum tofieldiae]GKT54612.1 hypothetical protein ColTof3_01951 [Colletotrichum tofieldiae]GKT76100.1 hypothetical protein ColTof4_08523 [Colletotrichum tofieldiae]GKT83848.1 hypothetical protein Ct61P_01698 [Colletotrichum tofieldiae]
MKYQAVVFATSTLIGLAAAGPYHHHHHVRRVTKREVPLEHSHEVFLNITREFLNKENPKAIADPVFGLLGDGAAKAGAGQVTNLACLQQETADQAFTNAKAAKDIRGMSAALVYQTLERNTAGVGVASAACTDAAVNPEIAALAKKHQDPASDNAAANNKAVALELAKQLAAVGGDPMLALESGTFAPGDKADTTGKGNTCDDKDDPTGCIFTQKKLVLDATPEEITAAVQGITPTITGGTGELKATHIDLTGLPVAGQSGGASDGASGASNNTAPANGNAATKNADNANNKKGASCKAVNNGAAQNKASNGTADANTGSGNNVQTFTGDLGGLPPPVIESSGKRPFSVNGDTFVGKGAALGRSCDVQHNACARAVNGGQLDGEVSQCDDQNAKCRAQASLRKRFFKRQATDFGSCSDPSVVFKDGLSDRKDAAFIANNQKDFNHGSAQKIGIIAGFICQRLQDSCKAPQATIDSCKQAQTAATAATQDETAANVFNSMLIGGASGANVTARANLRW